MEDRERLELLNSIRIIELSTVKERNPEEYGSEEEDKFSLMFDNQKLKNSVKLSSRYMKNIYCLLHEKDYFLYT